VKEVAEVVDEEKCHSEVGCVRAVRVWMFENWMVWNMRVFNGMHVHLKPGEIVLRIDCSFVSPRLLFDNVDINV